MLLYKTICIVVVPNLCNSEIYILQMLALSSELFSIINSSFQNSSYSYSRVS